MAEISINSHYFLGKLTIIRNCLSLLAKDKSPERKKLVKMAYDTNQELIDQVKEAAKNV
ncbi:MAG: hypothetical protein ABH867_01360 [Patescibacteria group bacterium]|nr:hypothetical protein [Patescibacteria group bacterium]